MSKNLKISLTIISILSLLILCFCGSLAFVIFSPLERFMTSHNVVARNCVDKDDLLSKFTGVIEPGYSGNYTMKISDLPVKFSEDFLRANNFTEESEIRCNAFKKTYNEGIVDKEVYLSSTNSSYYYLFILEGELPNREYEVFRGNSENLNFKYMYLNIPGTESYINITNPYFGSEEIVSFKEFVTNDGKKFYIQVSGGSFNQRLNKKIKEFTENNLIDSFKCSDSLNPASCTLKSGKEDYVYNYFKNNFFKEYLEEILLLEEETAFQTQFINSLAVQR